MRTVIGKTRAVLIPLAAATLLGALSSSGAARASDAAPGPPAERAPEQALWVIIYAPGPAWAAGAPMEAQGLRDHFLYLRELHAAGRLLLAGPVGADGGLAIIQAPDQDAADRVVATDPAVIAGKFTGRAAPFVARFVSERPILPVAPGSSAPTPKR